MQSAGTSILLLASAALLSCDGAKTIEGFPDEFAGVGLELGRRGERLLVVRPIEGGPSWEAGIRRDDEVISINGEPVTDLGLGDAVARLRGPPGTQLTLGLDRHGERLIVVLRRKKLTKVGDDYHLDDPAEGDDDPAEGDTGEAGGGGESAAGGAADEQGAKNAAENGEALAAGTAATPASAVEPPPTSAETDQPTKRQHKATKSHRRGKRGQKHKK